MKYIAIVVILLTGCAETPTNNIAEFGLAINNVSQQINTELDSLNTLAIQSQADGLAYLTLDQSKNELCQGSAAQIINGELNADLNSCNLPLRLEDLNTIVMPASTSLRQQMLIIQATQTLSSYAEGLTQLANVANPSGIQQNSLDLTTSIGELNSTYYELQRQSSTNNDVNIDKVVPQQSAFDDKQALIATAIATFATTITEEKRQNALKKVITQGNQVIEKLIPIIVAELEKAQLHQNMATLQRSALVDDIVSYNRSSIKRPLKHDKAAKSIVNFYQQLQQIQVAALKDQQLIQAFKQIGISHNQISDQINKDLFASKEIVAAITALNVQYQDLRDFKRLIAKCEGKIITDENNLLICQNDR